MIIVTITVKDDFATCSVMQCTAVLDPGFYAVDSEFHVLELGFRISIVNRIPDSLSWIADSKARNSGFHYQKFRGFRNPIYLTWGK